MKQVYTQAKKARRASAFHKGPQNGGQSKRRKLLREHLHPKTYKVFGCQVKYVQRILLKKDRFGGPIQKFVKHAVTSSPGAPIIAQE